MKYHIAELQLTNNDKIKKVKKILKKERLISVENWFFAMHKNQN